MNAKWLLGIGAGMLVAAFAAVAVAASDAGTPADTAPRGGSVALKVAEDRRESGNLGPLDPEREWVQWPKLEPKAWLDRRPWGRASRLVWVLGYEYLVPDAWGRVGVGNFPSVHKQPFENLGSFSIDYLANRECRRIPFESMIPFLDTERPEGEIFTFNIFHHAYYERPPVGDIVVSADKSILEKSISVHCGLVRDLREPKFIRESLEDVLAMEHTRRTIISAAGRAGVDESAATEFYRRASKEVLALSEEQIVKRGLSLSGKMMADADRLQDFVNAILVGFYEHIFVGYRIAFYEDAHSRYYVGFGVRPIRPEPSFLPKDVERTSWQVNWRFKEFDSDGNFVRWGIGEGYVPAGSTLEQFAPSIQLSTGRFRENPPDLKANIDGPVVVMPAMKRNNRKNTGLQSLDDLFGPSK